MEFDDSDPSSLLDKLNAQEVTEALEDLIQKMESGEAPKGALRLLNTDGTFQDLVWGYETEEERQSMLAMLEKYHAGNVTN